MKHVPLLPVCVAFLAGIVAEHYLPVPIGPLVAVCALLLAASAALILADYDLPALLAVYLLLVAAGAATHAYHYRFVPRDHIVHQLDDERHLLNLEGVVCSYPEQKRQPTPLLASWKTESVEERFASMCVVDLSAMHTACGEKVPVAGRVMFRLYEKLPGLAYGDRLTFVANVQLPNGPTNPG